MSNADADPSNKTASRITPASGPHQHLTDNLSSYSAATIINMTTEAETTDSSIGARRRRHRNRNKRDSIMISTDPSQHVMFLLGENNDGENADCAAAHNLFCELDELHDCSGVGDFEWKETARWIKFEEDVEENGERWSKPHVATLSLFSLFQVRSFLDKATYLFNLEAQTMEQIATIVVDTFIEENKLEEQYKDRTIGLLLKRHTHLHDRLKHKMGRSGTSSGLPIIRSLADIGKKYSSKEIDRVAFRHFSEVKGPSQSLFKSSFVLGSELDPQAQALAQSAAGSYQNGIPEGGQDAAQPVQGNYDYHFLKKIPSGAETSNILVGETDYLSQAVVAFIRLKDAIVLGEMTEVPVPTRFLFILLGSFGNGTSYKETGRSMATLMSDEVFHEVAYKAKTRTDLLAGVDEFLSCSTVLPPGEWDPSIRIEPPASVPSQENRKISQMPNGGSGLTQAQQLMISEQCKSGDLAEHAGPGALIADSLESQKSLKTHESSHALPDVSILDGKSGVPGAGGAGGGGGGGGDPAGHGATEGEDHGAEGGHGNDPALQRTGRFCGGLVEDVKRRKPFYLSDFTDALNPQCLSSFFFLYFACLTPIITFGGLLHQETGGYLGTIESILSGAVVGILYALFSGQPLTIQGSTGPVLVFEKIIFTMCKNFNWYYLSFRLWIGLWTSLLLLIMVAFDLSALVKYITRFTEESFATLIAFIFIIKAFEKLLEINKYTSVNLDWSPAYNMSIPKCSCEFVTDAKPSDAQILEDFANAGKTLPIPLINNSAINWTQINEGRYSWTGYKSIKLCSELGRKFVGHETCDRFFVPDVLFFSTMLFLATFFIAYTLKGSKTSPFFPTRVRTIISDFAVIIAIVLCTSVDLLVGLHTPKLNVPEKFEPSTPSRPWLVPFFDKNPWWTSIVALGPALLSTILIFMDQQITAVIVNRRENKLKKGAGYHLDLLVVTVTIIINSFLGIPWFVAATVLSVNHVLSLKQESESAAPGEKPVFLGCREQRVTGFFIFLLIGLSVFMTPVLKRIPMPVLYGVFLYMGVSSLRGVQMVDRLLLIFMPVKYQPDYPFLRHVRLIRVHLFTTIQVICFALLWVIKQVTQISIMFPLMVLAMCFVRKLLDYVFTQDELKWLDDIMPGAKQPKKTATFSELEMLGSQIKPVPSMDKRINITEEVSKTMIWRNLSGGKLDESKKKSSKKKSVPGKGKKQSAGHNSDTDSDYRKDETKKSLLKSAPVGVSAPVRFIIDDQEINVTPDSADTMTPAAVAKTSNNMNLPAPEIMINPPSGRSSPTQKS